MTVRSGRMVVAVVTCVETYQMELLRGARDILAAEGVSLVAYANYANSAEAVRGSQVDVNAVEAVPPSLAGLLRHPEAIGLILTPALSPVQAEALERLRSSLGIPVVHVGDGRSGQMSVRADNDQGFRAVMGHLLDEYGARRPALVRGLPHQPDHVVREAVFREEVARRGLTVDEGLVVDGRAEREVARNAVSRLLRRRRDLDAVVTTDDWCALATIDALAEAELRVPEDVAVTGFDNYPAAALHWPGLTSVDQSLVEQGATAARALLDAVAGRPAPERVLVPCRLVVRGSSVRGGELDDQMTAAGIARLARGHLDAHSAVRRVSRALTDCRSVDDVTTALASCLPLLGIPRFFLVLHEEGFQQGRCPDGTGTLVSRLVMDYRDGRLHPLPDAPFPRDALLPDTLRGELGAGFLACQLLNRASGVLGYLLTELPLDAPPVAEPVKWDLVRTLEALLSTEELRRANAELRRSAEIDGLTGIANRAAFERHLADQWCLHAADGGELALLMVDVDLFKLYNDRYGHVLGDRALRAVAACVAAAVGHSDDLACRFGGEEFVVVLPRTGRDGASSVARRIHRLLAAEAIPHDASTIAPVVTASIGLAAALPGGADGPETLLHAADQALYRAKAQGRDRTVADTDLAAGSLLPEQPAGSGHGAARPVRTGW
ncbi:MAG: diguanylate cyclase [Actinomycetales bacterium]|nr:diguanylate cyclase [Actinomycetales bacterium]